MATVGSAKITRKLAQNGPIAKKSLWYGVSFWRLVPRIQGQRVSSL